MDVLVEMSNSHHLNKFRVQTIQRCARLITALIQVIRFGSNHWLSMRLISGHPTNYGLTYPPAMHSKTNMDHNLSVASQLHIGCYSHQKQRESLRLLSVIAFSILIEHLSRTPTQPGQINVVRQACRHAPQQHVQNKQLYSLPSAATLSDQHSAHRKSPTDQP